MVSEVAMIWIMGNINTVLEKAEGMKMLTPDEHVGLKRALDVAADRWADFD